MGEERSENKNSVEKDGESFEKHTQNGQQYLAVKDVNLDPE